MYKRQVFYNAFASNHYIALLLKGMQAGVAAVILDVVFDLGIKVLKTRSWVYIALMAAAFIANTVLHVNVVGGKGVVEHRDDREDDHEMCIRDSSTVQRLRSPSFHSSRT